MSPCCIAAATATAVLIALTIVGLTAFVLVTDGFGLGLLVATLLAVIFQRLRLIGPCAALLYACSALLVLRACWLLATTRWALVFKVVRLLRAGSSRMLQRVTARKPQRCGHCGKPKTAAHTERPLADCRAADRATSARPVAAVQGPSKSPAAVTLEMPDGERPTLRWPDRWCSGVRRPHLHDRSTIRQLSYHAAHAIVGRHDLSQQRICLLTSSHLR
jgi:hypothetical protein